MKNNITDVIVAYLEKENFNPFVAYDGREAMDLFNNEEIHLIILDLMLPILTGGRDRKKRFVQCSDYYVNRKDGRR